jgi:hypothetical protein
VLTESFTVRHVPTLPGFSGRIRASGSKKCIRVHQILPEARILPDDVKDGSGVGCEVVEGLRGVLEYRSAPCPRSRAAHPPLQYQQRGGLGLRGGLWLLESPGCSGTAGTSE